MSNGILADARFRQRRAIMPTHEIVAAIDLATSLFPRCCPCLVHTILKQEAETTGRHAPSKARVRRLLEQHRASTHPPAGRSARSTKRRSQGISDVNADEGLTKQA
jgi:hypothetical protein